MVKQILNKLPMEVDGRPLRIVRNKNGRWKASYTKGHSYAGDTLLEVLESMYRGLLVDDWVHERVYVLQHEYDILGQNGTVVVQVLGSCYALLAPGMNVVAVLHNGSEGTLVRLSDIQKKDSYLLLTLGRKR